VSPRPLGEPGCGLLGQSPHPPGLGLVRCPPESPGPLVPCGASLAPLLSPLMADPCPHHRGGGTKGGKRPSPSVLRAGAPAEGVPGEPASVAGPTHEAACPDLK